MTIIPRLMEIYRSAGFEPMTGYNSYHFSNHMDAPFTRFLKESRVFGIGAGLALQEVMFLEHFRDYLDPQSILVIGNSMGWSTLALALTFPQAKVVGIDPNRELNTITNEIAHNNNINALAVDGASPQDVGAIVNKHLNQKIDIVLIDGIHENNVILDDFNACNPLSNNETIFIFHDVINYGMLDGFNQICNSNMLNGIILTRTPSGIAIAWRNAPAPFLDYVAAFTDKREAFHQYRSFCLGVAERVTSTIARL